MTDVRLTATNPEDSSVVPVACNERGELRLEEIPDQSFDGNLQGDLTVSGSASFAQDRVKINATGDYALETSTFVKVQGGVTVTRSGGTRIDLGTADPNSANKAAALGFTADDGATYSYIYADGGASFAGGKAGFTAEGNLWCTTRRGDTVILDATSNGLGSWVPYTPPNRLTELQDRWAEKDGILPVPHESSQDEPETPQ